MKTIVRRITCAAAPTTSFETAVGGSLHGDGIMQQCPREPVAALGQSCRAEAMIRGQYQHSVARQIGDRDARYRLAVGGAVPGAVFLVEPARIEAGHQGVALGGGKNGDQGARLARGERHKGCGLLGGELNKGLVQYGHVGLPFGAQRRWRTTESPAAASRR